MFFNSRKSHTFSVIQQLKTIGLLPARAWQQQSTKGALLWPANWSGAAAAEVPAASAASQHQHRCGRHDRLRRRLQHPSPRAAKNVSGAITGMFRCCTRRLIAAAAKRPRAVVRAARMPSRSGTGCHLSIPNVISIYTGAVRCVLLLLYVCEVLYSCRLVNIHNNIHAPCIGLTPTKSTKKKGEARDIRAYVISISEPAGVARRWLRVCGRRCPILAGS